jgi:propionate catabolism operon transcriptional regulator
MMTPTIHAPLGTPSPSKKHRFALVSHSIEVVNIVRRHIDPANEDLFATIVGLDDAVATAQALIQEGYDVILGHGGTGGLIARRIGQPVVNIPITMLELITALQIAGREGRSIGVTSFATGREGFAVICNVLQLKAQEIVFNNQRELEEGVQAAIAGGVDIIVGGGVSRTMAARLKVKAVIIEPGKQIVQDALQQARALATARRGEAEQHERLQTVFNIMDDGMICVDAQGRLNLYNPTAEAMLGRDLTALLGHPATDLGRDLGFDEVLATGAKRSADIIKIQGRERVVNCHPILVDGKVHGAVSLLKEGSAIQDIDRKLRERIYRKGFVARHTMADMVATSSGMQGLVVKAKRYAKSEAAILIAGETGTGKELLSHALHNASRRKKAPFVAINCAALPETLLESELFGYAEGAFTGAKKGGKIGLFELANRGTIFLDEIGDISPSLQVRLLRVLENKEVMRVGGDRIVPVDVRVISSTHKNLQAEMRAGRFREDLFYRLAVLRLRLPPLRRRWADIPGLLAPLLTAYKKRSSCITPAMVAKIESHTWPGNIRELHSLMESYLILLGSRRSDEDLFLELFAEYCGPLEGSPPPSADPSEPISFASVGGVREEKTPSLAAQLEARKRRIIQETLARCANNKTLAAKQLGISPHTLWRALKKVGR